jgi:hypothetical protein
MHKRALQEGNQRQLKEDYFTNMIEKHEDFSNNLASPK